MPDMQVKLTRVETVTLNFKAKDEDAEDWEIEEVYEV